MRIQPAKRLRGSVRLPGDKSISHRAALLAALAEPGGHTRIGNYATSADCASTLSCLRQLGVGIERAADAVIVNGVGTSLPQPADIAPLDCGNSGTTMRLLAGVLAGQTFAATLTGDDSLRTRPMRRVIEPLELMGARVASDDAGRAPLRIEGRRPLTAISYTPEVASAVMSHPFTRVVFRVGDDDARKLAEGFSFFEASHLKNLEPGQAICRVQRSNFDFNLTIPLPDEVDEAKAAQRREDHLSRQRASVQWPEARTTQRRGVQAG